MHVVIIGAGIGGLSLAQGLRQAGISTSVYERDAHPAARPQGYRISLKRAGAAALRECLPEPLYALATATALRNPATMAFVDEQLVPRFTKELPTQTPDEDGFGVNRLTLREILLADIDVHFGAQLDRYESTSDGRVRAVFRNGSAAVGDLLVGADGTNSAVRSQLLPRARIAGLECAAYGRTLIGDDPLGWLPDVLTDSFNRVTGPGGAGMAVATCRTREPVPTAVARFAPTSVLTDVPPYLAWMVTLPDDSLRDASPDVVHAAARAVVDGWHPALGRVIDMATIEATFPVVISSAEPVTGWAEENVTLLGDAIHTMSPGRGDGANIALRDASLLCGLLTSVAAGRQSLPAAKGQYEAEMLEYGFAAVRASLTAPFGPPRR